ncbi:MAG: T9SS type A sorting domain-containing protein, partial [Bacteroidia bacterium]|nr:T9SS type A sorting domain-containing protein [Bacteroidia bacterium]
VPNPAASHVSVTLNFGDNLPHFFDVAVFTVHGELVHKETAVYMTGNIDISEWPDGLYVVSASYTNATQSGVLVKKIVVLK